MQEEATDWHLCSPPADILFFAWLPGCFIQPPGARKERPVYTTGYSYWSLQWAEDFFHCFLVTQQCHMKNIFVGSKWGLCATFFCHENGWPFLFKCNATLLHGCPIHICSWYIHASFQAADPLLLDFHRYSSCTWCTECVSMVSLICEA